MTIAFFLTLSLDKKCGKVAQRYNVPAAMALIFIPTILEHLLQP